MEIEKRYRTYGIALGIDLGIEKRYNLLAKDSKYVLIIRKFSFDS